MVRIAKYISNCGYCSRREAERLIFNRCVSIENRIVSDYSLRVKNQDKVYVNNLLLSAPETSIWLYNKPSEVIVSKVDNRGRKVIFDQLPTSLKKLMTIGRLDYNSEGLLLLTNNGELARYLELPKNQVKRKYLVKVFGTINHKALVKKLDNQVSVDGINYQPIKCSIIKKTRYNTWLSLTLKEGKNREIRKILASFNLAISRLIRTEYGKFRLNTMEPGSTMEAPKEIVEYYINKLTEIRENL